MIDADGRNASHLARTAKRERCIEQSPATLAAV